MTRPTLDPVAWGTDATFGSGDRIGSAVKNTALSIARAAQGCIPGLGFPSAAVNHALHNFYGWLQYLRTERGRGVAGDGSDGDVTLGAGVTSLTRHMYYGDLTIPAGATLQPNGYYVFARGHVQIEGAFEANGSAGEDGSGPSDTAGGATAPSAGPLPTGQAGADGEYITSTGVNGTPAGDMTSSGYVLLGGNGGNGGNAGSGGTAGTGGLGGTANDPTWPVRHAAFILNQIRTHLSGTSATALYRGGAGGGEGAHGLGVSGVTGAGGGGGGIAILVANRCTIAAGGSFTANGGRGGNAYNVNSGQIGGGGGGGGGLAAILAGELLNSGTFEALGGAGGAGVGGPGVGEDGGPGSDGLALALEI